jgi:alpha-1,4-glucan:alpha-1,4-glucan 6-glycosyltransferase
VSSRAPLVDLAENLGLAASYTTSEGGAVAARPEALLAAIRGLGVDIDSSDRAAEVLAERLVPRRLAPPVVVAWNGRGEIRVDRRVAGGAGRYELAIELEEGGELSESGPLADSVPMPRLPIGYHRVDLRCGNASAELLAIAAPPRTWRERESGGERTWGAFAPLYAFGRSGGAGCGDLRDLETICELVGRRGGKFVGTLPLLAADLDARAADPPVVSPYAPVSRLFWNELYLDLERAPGFAECEAARAAFEAAEPGFAEHAERPLVDPGHLWALRRPVLEALAAHAERSTELSVALEAFASERPRLADYATFRAERAGDPDAARLHRYAQLALDRQLSTLADGATARDVALYLDLPVGSHPAGYDAWRFDTAFAGGLAAGAPPDLLFSGGQNWGFAPLHPERIRERGYDLVREMLAAHCRYAGILRLDHVMWLHRIYCVPDGFAATDGVYVHYRPEELWAIVCVESHRSQTAIIGEDLGTVPPEVVSAMHARGALGMELLQFGLRPDPRDGIAEMPADAIASLGSHDTAPFASFIAGTDVELRRELGHQSADDGEAELDEREPRIRAMTATLRARGLIGDEPTVEELAGGALAALASSPARMMVINLEDLWGELEPQNVPGTVDQVANWIRPARYGADQVAAVPGVDAILAEVDRRRRLPPEPMTPQLAAEAHPDARADVTALSADDIYLFAEGNHFRAYDLCGAHPGVVDGVAGCRFAVWAPNAESVAVVGDWNNWQAWRHPLAPRQASGIWEGFIPGARAGEHYKFVIRSRLGGEREKADPFAFATEPPPNTASVIADLDYTWHDGEWMARRAERSAREAPVSIYEIHLGSFMRVPEEGGRRLSYRELADRLIDHAGNLGFTHVELMPVMEHPFYGSWGYQTTGYFAPTARYGPPRELMSMIDRLHQAGIGVILDWVPSHFPGDEFALGCFDGTALYEHADPRLGFHPDWQSNIFNYGRDEVRSFLISSALWWIERYHADGLRVDGVASMLYRDYSRKDGEWIPNQYGGRENLEAVTFLRRLNEAVYARFPGVQTYAEESTAWPGVSRPTSTGGLGFGYKWDMGWMNDTLEYFRRDPVHRKYHHDEITFRMVYAFSENYVLSLSHDEVVHGKGSLLDKMPGDEWQRFANLRLLYGYMYSQPGKKLLFMGSEFGQPGEWQHDTSLDWHLADAPRHAGVLQWIGALNRLYRDFPALHERDCEPDGFEWIDGGDREGSVLIYARRATDGTPIVFAHNFTPAVRESYRIGLPAGGTWRLVANSDEVEYGGSGVSAGPFDLEARQSGWHGRDHCVEVTLPPLAVIALAPVEWTSD